MVMQQKTKEERTDASADAVGSIPVKLRRASVGLNATVFWTMAAWLLVLFANPAGAQTQDIHRLSDSHVQYRRFVIPKGKAVEIANLQGPWKITYFYITELAAQSRNGRFL